MKFATALPHIRTGDVFAFRGTALHSRLIQLWTRSVYSHVGIALWVQADSTRRLCVLEALEPVGVRLFPMDVYLELCRRQGVLVDWYTVTDPTIDRDKVAAYALGQWGKRYCSPLQLARSFGWCGRRLRRWLGLPAEREPERFFCSELCARALRHAGYVPDEADDLEPALTDPGAVTLSPCLQRKGAILP
jgi:hypothetical protein